MVSYKMPGILMGRILLHLHSVVMCSSFNTISRTCQIPISPQKLVYNGISLVQQIWMARVAIMGSNPGRAAVTKSTKRQLLRGAGVPASLKP